MMLYRISNPSDAAAPEGYERTGNYSGIRRTEEESVVTNQRYIVYINDPNHKSVGHLETCPHAKIWGGETTAAGGWLGPFGSREEAETAGQLSGNPFHWCGHCSSGPRAPAAQDN